MLLVSRSINLLLTLLLHGLTHLMQVISDLIQILLMLRPLSVLEIISIRTIPLHRSSLRIQTIDRLMNLINRLIDLRDQILHVLRIITEKRFTHEIHPFIKEPRNLQRTLCPANLLSRAITKNLSSRITGVDGEDSPCQRPVPLALWPPGKSGSSPRYDNFGRKS